MLIMHAGMKLGESMRDLGRQPGFVGWFVRRRA